MAVENAVKYGTKPNVYRTEEKVDDVEMSVLLAERIPVGDDIEIKVAVNNKSTVERNLDLIVNAHICFYTGIH